MRREKQKKIIIGLTGGIASGKSAVLNCFKKLGAKTLDSDLIARDVVKKGKPALREIAKKFGKEFIKKDGSLDRKKMAELIFINQQRRKELEKIIHPKIIEVYKKNIRSVKSGILIIDIPLLFEVGLQKLVDQVVVVWVPENIQIKRLMDREKISQKEALCRIHSQWALDKKKKLADFVIDNSRSLKETQKQVKNFFTRHLFLCE